MGIMCRLRGHRAAPDEVFNEGYYFSRCERCSADLIRTSGSWRALPSGYKLAWRSGVHRHAIASDFRRNLPRVPRQGLSWKLGLHRKGNGAIRLPGPVEECADVVEARRDDAYAVPGMVLVAVFAFFGFASRLPQKG